MKEQHLYIPPDAAKNINPITGDIKPATWIIDPITHIGVKTEESDWPKVYRFGNRPDRILQSFTGMGMPGITYITQSGPNQPGETILSFALEPRYIQYVHARAGACDRQEYWENRQNIGTLLSPARQSATATRYELGRLRVVLPNGAMRDIDAVIQDGPLFVARDPSRWMETTFIETLRFRCPDPTWYDPVRVDTTWGIEIYAGLIFYEATDYPNHLTFPDNALFGADAVYASTDITYTGTWFGYPTITITGPIAAPNVQNVTLSQKIALDYDVAAGEIVTINTTYGRKSVTNNFGDNLIGTLTNDSSLEFFLAHDPWATGGVNQLTCSGSGATVATSVVLSCYTRYIMI